MEARFDVPPCGSLLLLLSNEPKRSAKDEPQRTVRLEPIAPPQVRRLEDNVLVLNYLDWVAGGQTTNSVHCRRATRDLFRRNGFSGDPWFESVQFVDEHIRRTFPPDSGWQATYRFVIAERVPERPQFVLERPDLFQRITCNGVAVGAIPGAWWLDRCFGRIDIRGAARVGENMVTIQAAPFSVLHELETAYVLGNFSLRPEERGFAVMPDSPLRLAQGWNVQGHPFYSAGVAYAEEFDVPTPAGRYLVELPDWLGSVAKVCVNGESAGYVGWRPWQCDVTERIRPGSNQIEVTVIGTLRNVLGPHHAGPPQGIVTPQSFAQAPPSGPPPGQQYSTVGYGLFRPFVLRCNSGS